MKINLTECQLFIIRLLCCPPHQPTASTSQATHYTETFSQEKITLTLLDALNKWKIHQNVYLNNTFQWSFSACVVFWWGFKRKASVNFEFVDWGEGSSIMMALLYRNHNLLSVSPGYITAHFDTYSHKNPFLTNQSRHKIKIIWKLTPDFTAPLSFTFLA